MKFELRFVGFAPGGDRITLVVTQGLGEDLAIDCPAAIEVRAAFE
jgi:hypothetical protein